MTDTELIALLALVNQETVLMEAENQNRLRKYSPSLNLNGWISNHRDGYSLAYTDYGDYWKVLRDELLKRGVVAK